MNFSPVFANVSLEQQAWVDTCIRQCRQDQCAVVWFFIVAVLFYALKQVIVNTDLPPKVKTSMAFGLRLAYELLALGGIAWYVLMY